MRALAVSFLLVLGAGRDFALSSELQLREQAIHYLSVVETLAGQDLSEAEQERRLSELYVLGSQIAQTYFQFETEEEFHIHEELLQNIVSAHDHWRLYFIPLGNALIHETQKILHKRAAEVRHYRIAASIGGAILGGLAGASYQLIRKTGSHLRLGLIALGGTTGAGLGYFVVGPLAAGILIDFDLRVETAREFTLRYPHAEDFLESSEVSDLSLSLDALENLSED